MRILHGGDWHLTSGPRFADTLAVLEWIVQLGEERQVDVWSVAGDLAGTTIPHRASPEEKLHLARIFALMSETAPVFLTRGNHDYRLDPDVYSLVGGEHPVTYADAIQVTPFVTEEESAAWSAQVVQAPFPFKSQWLAADDVGGAIAEQDARAAAAYARALEQAVRGARQQGQGSPVVLLGHFNVAGSVVGGGEILSGHEVELTIEQVRRIGADLTLLSHIHKCQQLDERIWYAGSPTAQSFGEQTDRKCVLIADVTPGRITVSTVPTPARVLWTMEATYESAGTWVAAWPLDESFVPGSECRLQPVIPEAMVGTVSTAALEAELQRRGVVRVVVAPPRILQTTRVRCEAIVHASSLAEKLNAWAGAQDPAIRGATLRRLHARLVEIGGQA